MNTTQVFVNICIALIFSALLTSGARCPGKDWVLRKGTNKCYYISNTIKLPAELGPGTADQLGGSYTNAHTECRNRGGQLATIEDEAELEYLTAKFGRLQAYWVGMTFVNLKWQWDDGVTLRDYAPISGLNLPEFTYPMSNYDKSKMRALLDNVNGGFDLSMAIDNYAWFRGGYICKAEYSNKAWCDMEGGWVYNEGKCYQYNVQPKTFDVALSTCQASVGHLLVPNSKNEDDRYKTWLRENLPDYNIGWIGISIPMKSASTSPENVFWQDGTAMGATSVKKWPVRDLTNYTRGLPNNKRYCGEIYSAKGYYDYVYDYEYSEGDYEFFDEVHDWTLRDTCKEVSPFICESPLPTSQAPVEAVAIIPDDTCQPPFEKYHEGCYLVIKERKDRNSAQQHCASLGSTLAIINTFGENLGLQKKVTMDSWIGIKIEGKTGDNKKWIYKYSDDRIVGDADFVYFDDSVQYQQSNQTFNAFCVAMGGINSTYNVISASIKPARHGFWHHLLCTELREYMCYKPTTSPHSPMSVTTENEHLFKDHRREERRHRSLNTPARKK